ncbi:MAG: cysteine hydrolase family protein [Methylocella sp.]
MSPPKSLLQMVGAPAHPSPLERSALILIDIQREYSDGAVPLARVHEAAAEAAKVLELARRHNVPVFHIAHSTGPGGPVFDPNGPYYAFLPEVAPLASETVVVKPHANCFIKTDLDQLIRPTGRQELIIVGNMTHVCVSATARSAAEQYGYRVTVVGDATAARDLPNPLGGVVEAETVRQTALTELADFFAIVVKDASAWG